MQIALNIEHWKQAEIEKMKGCLQNHHCKTMYNIGRLGLGWGVEPRQRQGYPGYPSIHCSAPGDDISQQLQLQLQPSRNLLPWPDMPSLVVECHLDTEQQYSSFICWLQLGAQQLVAVSLLCCIRDWRHLVNLEVFWAHACDNICPFLFCHHPGICISRLWERCGSVKIILNSGLSTQHNLATPVPDLSCWMEKVVFVECGVLQLHNNLGQVHVWIFWPKCYVRS